MSQRYFRQAFSVEDPGAFSSLTLSLRRDDGGVVYLNAREVFRSNMPSAAITYTTLASSTVGGSDELAFFQTDLDPALLRAGTNVYSLVCEGYGLSGALGRVIHRCLTFSYVWTCLARAVAKLPAPELAVLNGVEPMRGLEPYCSNAAKLLPVSVCSALPLPVAGC
jgi:hypothetical protein